MYDYVIVGAGSAGCAGEPDAQVHCVPALVLDEGLRPGDGHGLTLSVNVSRPHSGGYLRLSSPSPVPSRRSSTTTTRTPETSRS